MKSDVGRAIQDLFVGVEERQPSVDLDALVGRTSMITPSRRSIHPAAAALAGAAIVALAGLPFLVRAASTHPAADPPVLSELTWELASTVYVSGPEATSGIHDIWATDSGFVRLEATPETYMTTAEFLVSVLVSDDGLSWRSTETYVVDGGRPFRNWWVTDNAITAGSDHGLLVIDRGTGSVSVGMIEGESITSSQPTRLFQLPDSMLAFRRSDGGWTGYRSDGGTAWVRLASPAIPRLSEQVVVARDGVYTLNILAGGDSEVLFLPSDGGDWATVAPLGTADCCMAPVALSSGDDKAMVLDVRGLFQLEEGTAHLISDNPILRWAADSMRRSMRREPLDHALTAGSAGVLVLDTTNQAYLFSQDGLTWTAGDLPVAFTEATVAVGEDRIVVVNFAPTEYAGLFERTVWAATVGATEP